MQTHRGFSLFELMIVMLIMAMTATGVSIVIRSASTPEKRIREAGEKIIAKMAFAKDEALIQNRVIGMSIPHDADKPASYYFSRYQDKQWETMPEPLSTETLPDDMLLDIDTDNALSEALSEEALNTLEIPGDDTADRKASTLPAVIFTPDGDVADFILTLTMKHDSDNRFFIYVNERGLFSGTLQDPRHEDQ